MLTLLADQRRWSPGLDNASSSLASVYEDMPKDCAVAIPWYVRLLENPKSPVALAGAIDLFGHDCVHILLGRGLLPQDEAFVIGFTMGRSPRCPGWHTPLFRWVAEHVYRGAFRFSRVDAEVFDFAAEAGRRQRRVSFGDVDFDAWLTRPLGELRAALGIDPSALRELYRQEVARWPHTHASARLALGGS